MMLQAIVVGKNVADDDSCSVSYQTDSDKKASA